MITSGTGGRIQVEGRRASRLQLRAGMLSSALVAIILIGGLKSVFITMLGPAFQNWLVVLYRINAGQLEFEALRVADPLDIALLALVGSTFVCLWSRLARSRRIWASIAAALPFIGIAVLLVTRLAGRSAVMGAGIIVSLLMLRTPGFKSPAYVGLAANALLLTADFATRSTAPFVAGTVAVGYVLLIVWFAWIAAVLWQLDRRWGSVSG